MNKKKNLNYFMNLDYNLILKKTKDKYYLFMPELSLMVENKSLDGAYKDLEREKEKYFKNIIKLKAEDTVRKPVGLTVRKKLFNELTLFFVKFLIILFAFLLVFLSTLPLIIRSLGQLPNKVTEVVTSLSDRLEAMPDENKEKLRLKLKQMAKELKPMTDELKILWEDEEELKQGF
ncbi:hypothetical protein COT75_02940 [Candidatus Beckwithbacteria bacterium CG10_big_fil_rev_8_21_14_0_10_34_10]|uniref:Uncharacterized protein n=1 Tax=Candidatus Beckwithbacteria bacterium CG10_big_fil_rev_8_21_14_0_10_34_10 TaxID=1974495 RepID=A0A2H0W959_9BACT|nr:MAG: hypothetical protein COT75_02940 [Candidatus Beckwithbacteria bacterium CG10_big_fil_rev_8_21_14_0_10_34_10]